MRGYYSRRRFIGALAGTAGIGAYLAWLAWPKRVLGGRFADGEIGYVAVAPGVLRPDAEAQVSVALTRGDVAARGEVQVELLQGDAVVARAAGPVDGRGSLSLGVPGLPEGEYTLRVRGSADGTGFEDTAKVRLEDARLLFVETDKPIYKPGQTLRIRVLLLDPDLRPAPGDATVEVSDAKGIKIFKRTVTVDAFGLASVDLPLSTEPNLGTWKVQASSGKRTGQVDVRVERYTLPKYEVKVELERDWALANDPVRGTVAAEYSYGRAVQGEVEIVASRYVGTWQEYARMTRPIDGRLAFEVPPVGYAAGSPAAGGQSQVKLDVTVREPATGYKETTNRLVTVASAPVTLRVIPESQTFKPGLPLSLLVVTQAPDGKPVDADVRVELAYVGADLRQLRTDADTLTTTGGLATLRLTPPAEAAAVTINASASGARSSTRLQAGYSPSGTFIHLEQVGRGTLKVGDTARFRVNATKEATNFYYEVVARGRVVFSDYASSPEIALQLTPAMAPEARLLLYRILPNAEVAADYLPFKVQGEYPQQVEVRFSSEEVSPGDAVNVTVQAEGEARVGLAAVDRSVFILAENRLNLQQVFDELERLFMRPQAELHEAQPIGGGPVPAPGPRPLPPLVAPPPAVAVGAARAPANPYFNPGAKEVFQSAGVVVLTNRQVPAGRNLQPPMPRAAVPMAAPPGGALAAAPAASPAAADSAAQRASEATNQAPLAELQRVRQFFPETWFWEELTTDGAGRATRRVEAPDSITTWMCRAVALSKERGLGIAEAQLRVFQPFFVQIDLPYAAIRGETLPAKVALYNYTTEPQGFQVELERADWFELLDEATRQVEVGPNGLAGVSFRIRPRALGVGTLKVTARSAQSADAIVKELIVEPEGVAREVVENMVLSDGTPTSVELAVPHGAVPGSGRAFVALTGNVLGQAMEGLDRLLQMSFGCGEQNMILFAPNVFVSRYLKETGQLKVEVLAKAEKLMLTGYQRELTYRRNDASFSAFGNNDKEGSLWLTAFVLKTFAQARGLIYIDDAVLQSAQGWLTGHQRSDGSFEPVGFVHHQELLGGLQGKTALTAFVAIALRESGGDAAAARAIEYLERNLDSVDEPYAAAITAYALGLAKSTRAGAALDRLMRLGRESEQGLYWPSGTEPLNAPTNRVPGRPASLAPRPNRSAAIETTGYAALALLANNDRLTAARALRWLAAQRNASGGFGSTQDTIVALQAMATAATLMRADLDATVTLSAGNLRREVRIEPANADVLQIIEVPAGGTLRLEIAGRGEVMAQAVTRFNLPRVESDEPPVFDIRTRYDTTQVAVDDRITIRADVTFNPPVPLQAGMVVVDIAVPTGFDAVTESLDALKGREPKLKRWDVAGRKVIFYIEDLAPGESVTLSFQARALYPVRAEPVVSLAYSYYRPEWRGEVLGEPVAVS